MSARAGASGSPAGAGIRSTIASRTSSTPTPVFAEIRSTRSGSSPSRSPSSRRRTVGIGLRKVDLVRGGDDLEPAVDREVRVRERLRLDALRRVDDEQRALARLQRARHLVREIDVAGRVDEIELVPAPGHAHRLRLDRDPALSLELHRVEELLAHVALRDGPGQLEDAIRERRLAVVDVRDDREIANAVLLHRTLSADRRGRRAGLATVATPRAREAPAPGRARRRRDRRRRAGAQREQLRDEALAEHRVDSPPGGDTRARPRPLRRWRPATTTPSVRPTCSSAEAAAHHHEQHRRRDDVHRRGRERDAPDAEPVEDGVEDRVQGDGAERDRRSAPSSTAPRRSCG